MIGPLRLRIRARLAAQLNSIRPRSLWAGLDLERNLLATQEGVEILDSRAVEEVFLAVLGCDKAEAAVGHQRLDGSCSHLVSPPFSNKLPDATGLSDWEPPRGAITMTAVTSLPARESPQTLAF